MFQFFAFLLLLHAALFGAAFLWNIRQMKTIDYLGAVRFFMGLGAAAIITFWMVNYVGRDGAKQTPCGDRSRIDDRTGDPNHAPDSTAES